MGGRVESDFYEPCAQCGAPKDHTMTYPPRRTAQGTLAAARTILVCEKGHPDG